MKKPLTKLALAASIALALAFTFACSGGDGGDEGSNSAGGGGPCPNAVTGNGTVSCGGKTYKTVQIDNQVWMAENLNYDVQ